MLAQIQRPNRTLESCLVDIYQERFNEGEEGFVHRALIENKSYVLKEFKTIDVNTNNIAVQNSYNAFNELKKLGFKIIEDYGIIKSQTGQDYLLLKDLGNRVWAEQGNGRGLKLNEYPEVAKKIRRNKQLSSIYGIGFGICDEHMIYCDENSNFDTCIVDVGCFHKTPFKSLLSEKIKREEFKSTNFKDVYSILIEDEKVSAKIFDKYEEKFPGKLEELMLEYESFISSCFRINDKADERLTKWAKSRGYIKPDNFLEKIIYAVDELYYFENKYKKRLLSLNLDDFDEFDKFDNRNLNNPKNLERAYNGVDFAFIYALDRDIARMCQLYTSGYDTGVQLTLSGKLSLPWIIDPLKFDKKQKVVSKVCLEPSSFRKKRGNGVFYADIALSVEKAFNGVYGFTNPGRFNPEDIKGFSCTRFNTRKTPIEINERHFKLKQKIQVLGNDLRFGIKYCINRPNGEIRVIHEEYSQI